MTVKEYFMKWFTIRIRYSYGEYNGEDVIFPDVICADGTRYKNVELSWEVDACDGELYDEDFEADTRAYYGNEVFYTYNERESMTYEDFEELVASHGGAIEDKTYLMLVSLHAFMHYDGGSVAVNEMSKKILDKVKNDIASGLFTI